MLTPTWINLTGYLLILSLVGLIPMLWFRKRAPRIVRRLYVAVLVLTGIGLAPIVLFLLIMRALRKSNVW